MHILVTGGAGFIGSNFIRYALENHPDWSVTNLDALTYAGNPDNLSGLESSGRYEFIHGDICDSRSVGRAFENAEMVVHFAAESHVDRSITGPEAFIRTNVLGTFALLEEARRRNIRRFHHVSTDEVFGSLDSVSPPFNEKTPYAPRSPYSASKAASDHLVRAYHETYGLPVTISNCSNNYGPYHFPEKLIPLAITNLLQGRKVPVYGDGTQVRDWLHVSDHCNAIDAILEKGTVGETYCVGGDGEMRNIDVIRSILNAFGKDEDMIEHVKDRPGHDRRYAIDFSKIKDTLGWTPSVPFDEGIKNTVEWYREHETWWKRCISGEYREYYRAQYGE